MSVPFQEIYYNMGILYNISPLIASGSVYYAGYGIGEEHGLDPRQLSRMRILHNGREEGRVTSIHAGLSYLVTQTAAIGKYFIQTDRQTDRQGKLDTN